MNQQTREHKNNTYTRNVVTHMHAYACKHEHTDVHTRLTYTYMHNYPRIYTHVYVYAYM